MSVAVFFSKTFDHSFTKALRKKFYLPVWFIGVILKPLGMLEEDFVNDFKGL